MYHIITSISFHSKHKCFIIIYSSIFISKKQASAYLKLADIQIFRTNFYCKDNCVRRVSQNLVVLGFFFYMRLLISLFVQRAGLNKYQHYFITFFKLILPLIIIAERLLQLDELSSKNLTDHQIGLKYVRRIADSKALRTYRTARHALCLLYSSTFSFSVHRKFLILGLHAVQDLTWICFPLLSVQQPRAQCFFFLNF